MRSIARAALFTALAGCAYFPPLPTPRLGGDWATHHVASPEIREASGLALANGTPPRLWTHNDSGDRARLFLIELDGALVAGFRRALAELPKVEWKRAPGYTASYSGPGGTPRSGEFE